MTVVHQQEQDDRKKTKTARQVCDDDDEVDVDEDGDDSCFSSRWHSLCHESQSHLLQYQYHCQCQHQCHISDDLLDICLVGLSLSQSQCR